ncbi:hypothetical protein MPC1_6140003 [Methylocella tundrae]|uniref:hypothetical protein n=1 Tax=Methylocella tundrae TaxID=227605 RepID=UPI0013132016|nr:hypothetical protein [Methylocella tundrae]VTZ27650.1 hypothetical protein MPC1_6140003 [Methylocella tundrae]
MLPLWRNNSSPSHPASAKTRNRAKATESYQLALVFDPANQFARGGLSLAGRA